MNEDRKFRGLLDGDDDDGAEASERTVGLGLGTSTEARRWMILGQELEVALAVKEQLEKGRTRVGRPSSGQGPLATTHEMRAFVLWAIAQDVLEHGIWGPVRTDFERSKPVRATNRDLIHRAQQLEAASEYRFQKRFTASSSSLESSVSQGRKLLGIDNEWRSEICDKLILGFH